MDDWRWRSTWSCFSVNRYGSPFIPRWLANVFLAKVLNTRDLPKFPSPRLHRCHDRASPPCLRPFMLTQGSTYLAKFGILFDMLTLVTREAGRHAVMA